MEFTDVLCTTSTGDRLMRSGNLESAKHILETALHRCWAAGTPMCVPVLAAVLIKVELRIGDLFAAAKLMPAMAGGQSGGWTWAARTDLCALMLMAEEQGSRAALSWLGQRRPTFVDQPELFAEEPAAGPWLVRLIRPADDRRLIDRVLLAAGQSASGDAAALAADHALALASGDPVALERIAPAYADPWCAARAWEDLSDLTGEAQYADEALALFDDIGAVRDGARVRQQLRIMGRRPAPPTLETAIDPAARGWAALTVTERTREQITRAQRDLREADAWSA